MRACPFDNTVECEEYCKTICGDEDEEEFVDIDRLSDYEYEWLDEKPDYWD